MLKKQHKQLIFGFAIVAVFVFALGGVGGVIDKASQVGDALKFWEDDYVDETDGVISATNWQISFKDEIDSGNAVTPTLCRVEFPDGSIETSATLASGYARFTGREVVEGMTLKVEGDSSTNYYSRVQTFSVPNIRPHDADDYPIIFTMNLWGMDASSDAGVVTVMEGQSLLYNGTGTEDSLAVDANTEYTIKVQFDWNAADDEYFGCEEYTQLAGDKYTYIPVIKVVASAGCTLDAMVQDGLTLIEHYNEPQGTSVVGIWQLSPIIEDDGITGDQITTFTFKFTPDGASGDTLDITLHDETRLTKAQSGYTSQSAVETVAQLTTT